MKNFDTRTNNISDFIEWNDNGLLELSPDFQRRSVWSAKAKSYLIDTIVRGKPMPKLLIQQKLQGSKNKRIVVDGQQRLRTIIEFYSGDFKISKVHNEGFAGRTYDTLPKDAQNEFLKYELGVDLLFDMPYEDILDIFARINSYTVKLKTQELYNARYVGYFKQTIFNYGLKYVRYFVDGKILTKPSVARMSEAELTADIFVALIDTVRTNKGIESYYKKYEEEEGPLRDAKPKFDKVMSLVGEVYPTADIGNTNWNRSHLFYSLFTAFAHCLYGLRLFGQVPRPKLNVKRAGRIRIALDEISLKYDQYTDDVDTDIPGNYKQFINFSRRSTTDTGARVFRTTFICRELNRMLK